MMLTRSEMLQIGWRNLRTEGAHGESFCDAPSDTTVETAADALRADVPGARVGGIACSRCGSRRAAVVAEVDGETLVFDEQLAMALP
jgi:hypothetical protein